MTDTIYKQCSKCHQVKAVTEFYKSKSGRLGVKSYCKSCSHASCSEHRRRNPEKHRAYQLKFKKKNPDSRRRISALFRKNHPFYFRRYSSREKAASRLRAENISAAYVASALLKLPIAMVPPALIEAKRVQLQILRLVRKSKQQPT